MPPISGLAEAAGAGGRVVADFISLASIRRAKLTHGFADKPQPAKSPTAVWAVGLLNTIA